jgi:Base plate wedge protein 53
MSRYTSTSPYYTTPNIKNYLDVINFRNISYEKDDQIYEVEPRHENRPDLLAYDIYGDSKLWWVFAVRNKDIIKDPVFDLKAGISIYIPKLEYLKNTLGI